MESSAQALVPQPVNKKQFFEQLLRLFMQVKKFCDVQSKFVEFITETPKKQHQLFYPHLPNPQIQAISLFFVNVLPFLADIQETYSTLALRQALLPAFPAEPRITFDRSLQVLSEILRNSATKGLLALPEDIFGKLCVFVQLMLALIHQWDTRLKALLDFYKSQKLETLEQFVVKIEQNSYSNQSFIVSAFVFLRTLVCSVYGSPEFLFSETTGAAFQQLTSGNTLAFSFSLEREKAIAATANYNKKATEQVEIIRAEVLEEIAQDLQYYEEEFQESFLGLQL